MQCLKLCTPRPKVNGGDKNIAESLGMTNLSNPE